MSSARNVSTVTSDGAAWLASAAVYPRSALAFWEERPQAPVALPCGSAFDVVSAPTIFGRRMLDRMWDEGPGSGPVAEYRGRMLLFTAPGTATFVPTQRQCHGSHVTPWGLPAGKDSSKPNSRAWAVSHCPAGVAAMHGSTSPQPGEGRTPKSIA